MECLGRAPVARVFVLAVVVSVTRTATLRARKLFTAVDASATVFSVSRIDLIRVAVVTKVSASALRTACFNLWHTVQYAKKG
jgi:hypothetical protein